MSLTILGITFHLYGFIVGLASIVGYSLSKQRAQQLRISPRSWKWYVIGAVVGGLVGARLYHVATDWQLYADDPLQSFAVWEGGLGNVVNQELYGLPTSLPWGIFIDPMHRLEGYEQYAYFHPLFAYEALALVVCAIGLWLFSRRPTITLFGFNLGSKSTPGTAFSLYLIYYSIIRFLLEFLRINTTQLNGSLLSVNQYVISVLLMIAIVSLLRKKGKIKTT